MVVNAPQSNILSAAEHTMALLLAQARNVPQAHAALERRPLGAQPVGGRRAGRQDARRSSASAASASSSPSGPRPSACASSPTTRSCRPTGPARWASSCCRSTRSSPRPTSSRSTCRRRNETIGLINRDLLLKAKPTLRVINVARGGIVDEGDLAEAIRDGVIAGAALDVFATEPTTESPLFELDAGRRHAAPRGHHPRGAGQGRRHDRRHGRSWRSPASSCRSPSTSTRPRRTRRCARSCRWPSGSGGCSPRWSASCRKQLEVVHRGRDRRLRHPHPHAGRARRASSARSATSR